MSERVFSDLMREIKAGKFVFTGELEPEKTTNLHELIEGAKVMKDAVVAANVTDNPQSMAYMSSLVAAGSVQKESGLEMVYQLRCSDRNRIALFSDLLGAGHLGIRNILALTGDHTALGDMPGAKPVFDLDSGQLCYLIRKMVDDGTDLNGKEIHDPPKFHVGVAGNPNCEPMEAEILKLGRKIEAGAEFVQTQVIYDVELAKTFLKEMERYNFPVLIGIFPMKSYGVADYFDKYIPGVSVPKEMLTELKAVKKSGLEKPAKKQKYAEVNFNFFVPFIKEIMKTTKAAGVHVMAVGWEPIVVELIKRARGE